jgi:Glycosyl transferase family 2
LFDYLRKRHPECEHFLAELERYQRSLYGDSSLGRTTANNIYHCLHQFMAQALIDTARITVDAPEKHLGITVGVITRNRANDLAEMLDSLTRQVRPPDEVLVVDNGSTDCTQAVLARFRDRLPLRCQFLERADIPAARNLVIENAGHEIVSFIDDDCISEPEWLAAVERGFLRADNIGIVGGWVHHEPASRRSTVDNYYRIFHHSKS